MGLNKNYYGIEFFPDIKGSKNGYITEKTFKEKTKIKPTLEFKRVKHKQDGQILEPEKEFGVSLNKDRVGVYFKKKFKKGGYSQGTCWDGYVQKGMKKKGNKMVPNCAPAGS